MASEYDGLNEGKILSQKYWKMLVNERHEKLENMRQERIFHKFIVPYIGIGCTTVSSRRVFH